MTFFDELGLRAAEQLETSVGAYIALASYRRLFAAPPPIRGKAVLGALRCAAAVSDDREIESLAISWSLEAGVEADATDLAIGLARAGRAAAAKAIANAELERKPTARAAYVAARASDDGGAGALAGWDRAIEAARRAGDDTMLAASVARWLELAVFGADPPATMNGARSEILARASLVRLEVATPSEKLVVARARLLAPSKFARASALSTLVDLARSGPDVVTRHAVLACARHVDAMAGRLDAVEIDRVRASLKHWPDEAERERALARLDALGDIEAFAQKSDRTGAALDELVARVAERVPEIEPHARRVRALARGGDGRGADDKPAAVDSLELRLATLGIDAIAALKRERPGDAASALVRAAEALPPIAAVPPALYAASLLALARKEAPVKRAASTFLSRALARSFGAPPGGFLRLGLALARAGFVSEARDVLREARRLKEPDATKLLAELERKLAYDALRRGDRAAALVGLRAAKALFASESQAVRRDP